MCSCCYQTAEKSSNGGIPIQPTSGMEEIKAKAVPLHATKALGGENL
jgi:hypothetical protein